MMKFVILLLLPCSVFCAAFVEDILQEDDWSFQTFLGDSIAFHCNDSQIMLEDNDKVEWILSNRKVITSPYVTNKFWLDNENNINGSILHINNIEEGDKGIYLCCKKTELKPGCRQHTIRGLNIVNHKIHNLFDRYENNLIVAVIAALIFFVPLMAICLIYKYRYLTEEDRQKEKIKKLGAADSYQYNVNDDMQYNPTSADNVKSVEGDGSYYNPSMETKL